MYMLVTTVKLAKMPFTIWDLYLLSIDHGLKLQSKSALKIFANKLIELHGEIKSES